MPFFGSSAVGRLTVAGCSAGHVFAVIGAVVGSHIHHGGGVIRAGRAVAARHHQRDRCGDDGAGRHCRQDLLIGTVFRFLLRGAAHLLHEPLRKVAGGRGVRCQSVSQKLVKPVVFPFIVFHGRASFPCVSVCMTLGEPKRFPLFDKMSFNCALARFSRDFTVPEGSFSAAPISS